MSLHFARSKSVETSASLATESDGTSSYSTRRTISPASKYKLVRINHWLGINYQAKRKAKGTDKFLEELQARKKIPFGMSLTVTSPCFLGAETGNYADSASNLDGAKSNVFMCEHQGCRIHNIRGRFDKGCIPFDYCFTPGYCVWVKQHLLARIRPRDGETKSTVEPAPGNSAKEKGLSLHDAAVFGDPLPKPSMETWDPVRCEDGSVRGPPRWGCISFKHSFPFFDQAIFDLSRPEIPSRVWEIIATICDKHPNDLIYVDVALQKAFQWVWIMVDPKRRIEEHLISTCPLDFDGVTLESWIVLGHAYETWHQQHRLAAFQHPVRWCHELLKAHRAAGHVPSFDKNESHDLIELQMLIKPLLQECFRGHILPCSMKGSSIANLIGKGANKDLGHLHRSDEQWQIDARLPDWRSLYFPTITMFKQYVEGLHVTSILRPLRVPEAWIFSEALRKASPLPKDTTDDSVCHFEDKTPERNINVKRKPGTIGDIRSCESDDATTTIAGPIFSLPDSKALILPDEVAGEIAKMRELPLHAAYEVLGYPAYIPSTPAAKRKGETQGEEKAVSRKKANSKTKKTGGGTDSRAFPKIEPTLERRYAAFSQDQVILIKSVHHDTLLKMKEMGVDTSGVEMCPITGLLLTKAGADQDSDIPGVTEQEAQLWRDLLSAPDPLGFWDHIKEFSEARLNGMEIDHDELSAGIIAALEIMLEATIPVAVLHVILHQEDTVDEKWFEGKCGTGNLGVKDFQGALMQAAKFVGSRGFSTNILISGLQPGARCEPMRPLLTHFHGVEYPIPKLLRFLMDGQMEEVDNMLGKVCDSMGYYEEFDWDVFGTGISFKPENIKKESI